MKWLKSFLILVCCFFSQWGYSQDGFLKAEGKRIVDGRGENILLRGIGLGGWMLQEGYMLHLYNEGQQSRVRQRIEALISKEQTQEFYNLWLPTILQNQILIPYMPGDLIQCACPCTINFTLYL